MTLVTIAEASWLTGRSAADLEALTTTGGLTPVPLHGTIYVPMQEVAALGRPDLATPNRRTLT